MEELLFIKLILNKNYFIKYKPYLSKLNLEKEIKQLLNIINSYYEEYKEKEEISLDELIIYFNINNPLSKDKEEYSIIFNNIKELRIDNEALVKKALDILIEKYYASDIIESLTQVLSGTQYGIVETLPDKVQQYLSESTKHQDDESPFLETNLTCLLNQEILSSGLSWALECLNKDVGPLRGATLGHVFARPDTGKTTFLASQAAKFAGQLEEGEIIAWFNNEEAGERVKLRNYSAVLNATTEELTNNQEKAEEFFAKLGGNKIKIYDNAIISIADIEVILKEHKVRLVIIDQGDKVRFYGDKEMAGHERLTQLYGKFRELGKKYRCDIITAGQASADAEGLMWLRLDMMSGSKTGKQGELDYAIGLGYTPEEGKEYIRYVHIVKNKMNKGVHGKHIVRIDTLRARYEDLSYSSQEEEYEFIERPVRQPAFFKSS